jgi:ubiquinone biosynthesis protein
MSRFTHLSRYGDIISILVRYGFGDLLSRLDLHRYLQAGKKLLRIRSVEQIERIPTWDRVRLALEELGPTFIKLGQFAANRPDVFPFDLIASLEKLQDSVSPFPREQAIATIERDLKRPVAELFERFDDMPFASASMAQVYRAFLHNGCEVAVKVQRPHLEEMVAVDLSVMRHLSVLIEKHIDGMSVFSLQQLVEEFAGAIGKELDFAAEAQHAERFAANFRDDPELHIPSVLHSHSGSKVLTTEFIHGIKVTSIDALMDAGLDPREIARRGARIILKQIFEDGFFHADPHAGNILVTEGNAICFLDFGMVGTLTPRTRHLISEILLGVVRRDPEQVVRVLRELTPGRFDRREFLEYEIAELLQEYSSRPIGAIRVNELMRRLSALMQSYRFKLVPGFYLLLKALITIEVIGCRLDPAFNLMEHITPFAERLVLQQQGPLAQARKASEAIAGTASLFGYLPREIRETMHLLNSGSLGIEFEHRGLDPALRKFGEYVNRLVYGLVLASLIIGSSIVVLSNIPPKLHGLPVIGLVGFLVAGIMGFWLLISISRNRKT